MQQDKQKYDCSVYSTGSVKPSEEDTKSACQKAEGSFCHPEMENDETLFFFCIIGAGHDNKVTAFEEACKFGTQYLVSYRERKYGRVREILYLIKFLSVNELVTLPGPECKSFEETN
ncbi:uncharacterized protein ARB_02177 [Trichophyton benhamiae CBS 112371]|uniref:Uncharacterized protein n=1 Tax=Arthroderma benhamiae (strain ATCC MYA-4681 / CBS 112371) TaxID=663331 RepID=D4B148_ARTBC|nr:uncharacterized protein ARB_02177 [Trichophyton benhamiae CBS 112371]EFE30983.1 hypothetical protein ARB_02177 [Trichophyton benhamiae CBS 112371]